jgi:hypothetical protein
VKNTIIKKRLQTVNLGLNPIKSITPKTISKMTTTTAINKASGTKKGMFKTPSEKYSSSLNEKPTGSFSFINPEIINNNPTRKRTM